MFFLRCYRVTGGRVSKNQFFAFFPSLSLQIVSLLNGEKLLGGGETELDTVNALGTVNGKQLMASSSQVDQLKQHIQTYTSPYKDLRLQIRKVEKKLLTQHAGFLIGNQCIDFQKQDGVTEIEESIMANTVERRLNDLLLQDESSGNIVVNRQPIYVSAVSNFTNFLDLSRKSIRSLEVGIPVVVLGRSQTSQHSYRWTKLLSDLCAEESIDPGMITFLSCTLDDIKDITSSCQESTGNLYTTCSRALAKEIKKSYPKTIASTGGPNTLVCTDWDQKNANHVAIQEAIACSASIESAGQCTALRHCVIPNSVEDDDCLHVFDNIKELTGAEKAMEESVFAGIFPKHPATPEPPVAAGDDAYRKHGQVDAFLKIRQNELPEPGINEYWRKVVVDWSKMDVKDEVQFRKLTAWLNENQPISLAINGPRDEAVAIGLKLWERTGMVVNTIGSSDDPEMPPALTCQARPQEAECFGEFPPRSSMNDYTIFPVIVPSSNPSYDAHYSDEYLRSRGASLSDYFIKSTRTLLEEIHCDIVRGYCVLLIEYLQNVAKQNPKQGFGKSRTAVWGIQRPPLGMKTLIRCGAETTWDSVAPIYILFHATNARNQVELSIDSQNAALAALAEKGNLPNSVESKEELTTRVAGRDDIFHHVDLSGTQEPFSFPMVGNFTSLYLPFGHIKSTKSGDNEFATKVRLSEKWLNSLF